MILTCPACATQYFADDATIGDGRTVRCASCGESWYAQPELSLEDQMAASDLSRESVERERQALSPTPSPAMAIREKEFAKQRARSRIAAGTAWSLSALAFFAGGAAAVAYRDDVVRIWPNASAAYAWAGYDVNRFGLEFARIDADRSFDGTTPILTVTGEVVNVTDRYQAAPLVRIDLRDEYGNDVHAIYAEIETDIVSPGGNAVFASRLDSPPLEAFDLAVSFVQPDSYMVPAATEDETAPNGQPDVQEMSDTGETPDQLADAALLSDPANPTDNSSEH